LQAEDLANTPVSIAFSFSDEGLRIPWLADGVIIIIIINNE